MGWALNGWKTAFNYLLLCVTHACLREHICRIPFWQQEIISALDLKTEWSPSSWLGGRYVRVCKANCLMLFQTLPKYRHPRHSPSGMAARKVFSCLKTSQFNTILGSVGGCQRGPLSLCASLNHRLSLGRWLTVRGRWNCLACTIPSVHPRPLPFLYTCL